MIKIPFKEIQKYVSENCPFRGLCFLEDKENRCRYEMMDGIPCRYMPKLIVEFKEIWEKKK